MTGRTTIKFTPLYGCSGSEALCYVLQVGDANLLLDCGWEESFTEDLVAPLKEWAPRIDAVLLSQCSLSHIGALPYAVGKLGLKAPIYGTLPIQKMGSLLMYDQCLSRMDEGPFSLFNLDDVDAAFNAMRAMRYLEYVRMDGRCEGITVTPFCAGHTLGGAVWRINAYGEDVVYAVDYNHRRERHLNGASLEAVALRPAVMVTSAYSYASSPFDRRSRDAKLADTILATLRGDGNVLLPVDNAGRVLELLLFLDGYWAEKRIVYPLVFLNRQAYNTIEFAKSQLEWMSDSLARRFEKSRDHFNPFETRYLKLMHSTSELERLPPSPVVVVATSPGLETGFSRELFAKWASDGRNAVIFTEKASAATLAGRVQSHNGRQALQLSLSLSKTVPLEGEELEAYKAEQERLAQEKREAEAVSEVDMEQQSMGRSSSAVSQNLLRAASIKSQPSVSRQMVLQLEDGEEDDVLIDFRCGQPPEDAAAPMFPDEDGPEQHWDEYGCDIDPQIASLKNQAAETGGASDVMMADAEEEEEVPTKVVTKEVDLEVSCRIHTFDYEGRTDGRSMRTIVTHVAPRRLLLVHGPDESTERMLKVCESELQPWKSSCRAPAKGETIDISPSYPTYEVQMENSLLPSMEFREMGGSSFAWVSAMVEAAAEEGMPPSLRPVGRGASAESPGSVFIGDARLSAVKQALAEAGIQAEFNGGVLVCSSNITVRRGEKDGSVLMEGGLCEEYYRVRDIVYGQFHIC